MTQAQILAEAFLYNRKMTLGYFEKLRDKDIFKEFEIDGKKLNSAYWIIGHLPVTQNYLLLRSTGGEIVRFAWAKPFGLGGSMPAEGERVSIEEILKTMQEVTEKSIQHISTLTDEQLALPNTGGMNFGDGTIKATIQHAIWHEGTHAGHLGWLCKLHGIKTL